MQTTAYGEIKAPADVDTLRDDECPVCSATDLWDGNECRNCQYVAPPAPFRDPDLDLAKSLDLRKDIADDAADLPEQEPGEATQTDGEPLMADQVDENGEPIPPEEQQLDEDGEPLDPDQISEDGTPEVPTDVDPEAAAKHFNQGGEPFTPGPNAPTEEQPAEPLEEPGQEAEDDDEDQTPESLAEQKPEQGLDDAEQVAEEAEESGAMPAAEGPNAEGPGLLCPTCGFETNAASPTTVNRSGESSSGDGMMDGDVCPNCMKDLLQSRGDIERAVASPAPLKALM